MPRGRPRKSPRNPRHKINEWLAYKGIKPVELADRLDVAQTTITRLLSGDSNYTQQSLEPIAEAIGVEVGDLISVDPTAPTFELFQVINGLDPENRGRLTEIAKALLRKAS